jgi:hypothetical protein
MANEGATEDPGGQQPDFVKGEEAAVQAGGVKPARQSERATHATAPETVWPSEGQSKAAQILRENAAKDTGTSAPGAKETARSSSSQTRQPTRGASDRQSSTGQSAGDSGAIFSALEADHLSYVLIGALAGYVLGWLIHGQPKASSGEAIPDYARTRA